MRIVGSRKSAVNREAPEFLGFRRGDCDLGRMGAVEQSEFCGNWPRESSWTGPDRSECYSVGTPELNCLLYRNLRPLFYASVNSCRVSSIPSWTKQDGQVLFASRTRKAWAEWKN